LTALNQNRYDQLLRRVGDLKGPGSKVNDALTELFPMLDVENVPAELLLLQGSRLCMASVPIGAGGPGFFSTVILRNSGGSGALGRLIEVHVESASTTVVFGPTQNSNSAAGARAFADTRVFGEGTVLVTQGNNNLLALGSDFWRVNTNPQGTYVWRPPAAISVIAPGGGFQVTNNSADVALQVNFLWIERQAQPSELNL